VSATGQIVVQRALGHTPWHYPKCLYVNAVLKNEDTTPRQQRLVLLSVSRTTRVPTTDVVKDHFGFPSSDRFAEGPQKHLDAQSFCQSSPQIVVRADGNVPRPVSLPMVARPCKNPAVLILLRGFHEIGARNDFSVYGRKAYEAFPNLALNPLITCLVVLAVHSMNVIDPRSDRCHELKHSTVFKRNSSALLENY